MNDIAAASLSRADIENYAWQLRQKFGLEKQNFFPVVSFLELAVPRLFPDFEFEVKDDVSMGAIEGMNCLGQRKIILPQSVYEEACDDSGRARFTVAHEIGHLFLHPKERLMLNRSQEKLPAYLDPEWQANEFAASLLMPKELVRNCRTFDAIVEAFGVSAPAAKTRLRIIGGMI